MPEQADHEKARAIAEEALDKYAAGDRKQGDALAEKAAQIDRTAVEEVVADLDEDAEANHDPAALSKD